MKMQGVAEKREFQLGDLVRTNEFLLIRKDGFLFGENDQKVTEQDDFKTWLVGADELPKGSLCTFIRYEDDDHQSAVIRRDIHGRPFVVRISHIELLNAVDDAGADEN